MRKPRLLVEPTTIAQTLKRKHPYPRSMADDAIDAVLTYFTALEQPISRQDLLDRSRDRYTVKVRAVVMYLLKTEGMLSYPAIGKLFGRDHTSVMGMVRRVHDLVDLEDLTDVVEYAVAAVEQQALNRRAKLVRTEHAL